MKSIVTVFVLTAVAALLVWPSAPREQAFGQVVSDVGKAADGSMIALSFAAADGKQQVTVIDPARRSMGVYHIDSTTGAIELKSMRRIEWDLNMTQFNAVDPLPEEIRSFIEQNRK